MGVVEQREFGRVGVWIEVRVSLGCAGSWTRKQEEWSKCLAMTILAFLGSDCQLACIVVFVVVLLSTGVVEVTPDTREKEIGKKGGSPDARNDMNRTGGNQAENTDERQRAGGESNNQQSQKREIRRKGTETTKHKRVKSESARNTAFIAHPTNLLYRLVPPSPQAPTSITEMRENSPKTAPEAEDISGEPRNTVPERERTEMVMPALLP